MMEYDKEFHLCRISRDAFSKSLVRNGYKKTVVYMMVVYVCALVKQVPIFSLLPPTAS